MKIINSKTKITQLIKEHPQALEAVIDVSPKFEKFRNPELRKVFVGRTTIQMAADMAGCEVSDIFDNLKPLGFDISDETISTEEVSDEFPDFIKDLATDQIIDFDVRPMLAQGNDPLTLILGKIKTVEPGQALKIINTFEPIPLINMLEKQGFKTFSTHINDNLVETYFLKQGEAKAPDTSKPLDANSGWDEVMTKFKGNMVEIDVRELEMPMPMHTILGELETLPDDKALFVFHKKIPLFLLPELGDKNYEYRINEISEGNVHLLIYKA